MKTYHNAGPSGPTYSKMNVSEGGKHGVVSFETSSSYFGTDQRADIVLDSNQVVDLRDALSAYIKKHKLAASSPNIQGDAI